MPATLGYWSIHGLAEPIRLMLDYLQVEYKDEFYHWKHDSEAPRDEWLSVKFQKGLDFPNLPYYIDGDIRLTQSNAIIRHLARKHKLTGANEHDLLRIEMCEQECVDLRMNMVRALIGNDIEKSKAAYVAEIPNKLRLFEAFLGKHEWFGGSKLSYVDFMMYSVLNWHRILSPGCLDPLEHLKAFMHRFEALPRIGDYMNSHKFKSRAIFTPFVSWGNKPIDN